MSVYNSYRLYSLWFLIVIGPLPLVTSYFSKPIGGLVNSEFSSFISFHSVLPREGLNSFYLAEVDAKVSLGAQLPPTETVEAFIGVTIVSSIAAVYWWNVVVPQKRKELLQSKNQGEVRDYLDTLRDEERNDQKTASKSMLRWFFTDWLTKKSRPKSAALPFLKKAKWNSGDNPILVASGAIIACVIAASLAERGFGIPTP
eukprot:gene10723-22389_t